MLAALVLAAGCGNSGQPSEPVSESSTENVQETETEEQPYQVEMVNYAKSDLVDINYPQITGWSNEEKRQEWNEIFEDAAIQMAGGMTGDTEESPLGENDSVSMTFTVEEQSDELLSLTCHTYYAYEDVPSWVDRVYASDLIMQQYDYYGLYQNGFLNSIFGQRDVTQTTEGYNYIAINDDVYMYTGVTSVTSDQSNIGFLLSNQRTKETFFYPVAGATEASAQASAQSQVQQMRYVATFPLLLNIADQPTYFMSLKGDDGLVKMYAMVNVQQYQIVETGQTVADCEANYRRALAEIRTAVMEGNSYYFLRLEGQDVFYTVSAADSPIAVILNVGDEVSIAYTPGEEGSILTDASVERLTASTAPAIPAGEATGQEETAQPAETPAA